jgi:hypothetical protein
LKVREMIRCGFYLVLIVLAGCESQGMQPSESTSTDSAGVRIVSSIGTPPQYDATLIASIGAVTGDQAHTFNQVGDAILLHGSVFVLDKGDNTVKVYDLAGQYRFSIGREGEGPGEFKAASNLIAWYDTIAVFDRDLQRITKFQPDTGALLSTERMPYSISLAGFPFTVVRLSPGRYLIVGGIGCQLPRTTDTSRWRVLVAQEEAGITDTLASRVSGNSLPFYGEGDSFCSAPAFPFGASPVLAADSALVAVAPGERGEVRIYDEARALDVPDEIWRYELPGEPVTVDEQNAYKARFAEVDPKIRDAFSEALKERGFPEQWPSVTGLLMDRRRRVWAQRGAPDDAEHHTWDVLDPRGRHLATVRFPSGVRLLTLGDGYAAGMRRDELDVQHVDLFSIPDLKGLSP